MHKFCALASGSKGNAYLLTSSECNILIDAGISAKGILERLDTLGVCPTTLDAILVTHEHIDHIRALKILSCKYNLPILCNAETAKGICAAFTGFGDFQFKIFTNRDPFEFKGMKITAFPIQHDALDPVGFSLEYAGFKVGICTDLGFVNPLLFSYLERCNLLVLEANHTHELVWASKRSMTYKQRVIGRFGHLSNGQCADLISSIYHTDLKHVFLAHLSEECNRPDEALKTVKERLEKEGANMEELQIRIADQYKASDFVELKGGLALKPTCN